MLGCATGTSGTLEDGSVTEVIYIEIVFLLTAFKKIGMITKPSVTVRVTCNRKDFLQRNRFPYIIEKIML